MPLPPALASTSLAALKSSTAVVKVFQKIDQTPLRRWLLMQNKSIDKRIAMPELPWSSHWAYFQGFDGGEFALSDASPDGLLPVLDARRRWAGGSFTYDADAVNAVRVGDLVQRSTRIAQVQEKRGRSGQFAVLTIEDSFRVLARSSAALALSNDVAVMNDFANIDAFRALQPLVYPKSAFTETREIVYPLKPFPAPTAVEPKDMSLALNIEQESMTGLFKGCQAVHELRACPDLLFRFSALTNNDHRIHYDAEYAKREEGLPGVLVHGPLAVTLACDALQDYAAGARLKQFTYRNVTPIICGERFYIGISESQAPIQSKLTLQATRSSATGFLHSVWGRAAASPHNPKQVELSIWNANRQLAVTVQAAFH